MPPNNPMTEGEALAVLRELRDTGDVSDWQAMESALTMAVNRLTAHTAASGGEVGEVYGPKATSTMVALHRPLPPGTKLYAAPPSAPVGVEGLVTKWRGFANDALRRSGTWNGNDIADRIEFMADELEALAQQPAQAAPGEFVVVDGRSYALDTVRTALLGLAADVAATPPGDDAAGGGFDDPAYSFSANPYEEPRP